MEILKSDSQYYLLLQAVKRHLNDIGTIAKTLDQYFRRESFLLSSTLPELQKEFNLYLSGDLLLSLRRLGEINEYLKEKINESIFNKFTPDGKYFCVVESYIFFNVYFFFMYCDVMVQWNNFALTV